VVFGGFGGGFIGTTAYDGNRVYGATAIGDFGSTPCSTDPRDTPVQEPSMHAFNPDNGSVAWQQQNAQNFGPTTLAGGMTFAGYVFGPLVEVRDIRTGSLVTALGPLQSDCFCGIAASGNGVFFGTGSPEQGVGDGIYAFTSAAAKPSPSAP
jgi:outer membrane protein assembly factor BamB